MISNNPKDPMKPHRLLLAAIVIACFAFASSCKALSGGAHGFPVIVVIDARSGDTHPLHGRTNGNLWLYRADTDVLVRVLNTDGLTIIEHKLEAGKVGYGDRHEKIKKSVDRDAILPPWLRALFPDGEEVANAMGFHFEPDPIPDA